MEEKETKTWKTHGVFTSYEEAKSEKEKLSSQCDLVKIKRSGKNGLKYKVKFWNEDVKMQKTQTKKKSKSKGKK
jgi:hypothetical protein